jgi:hypothetical protein
VTPREELTELRGEETDPDILALLTGILAYYLDLEPEGLKLLKIQKEETV